MSNIKTTITLDGDGTMNDHEIAYEQNVTDLEIAWRDRIESYAESAVRSGFAGHRDDKEGLRLEATEAVEARLFCSEQWANVRATDISDIAYEVVGRVIDAWPEFALDDARFRKDLS